MSHFVLVFYINILPFTSFSNGTYTPRLANLNVLVALGFGEKIFNRIFYNSLFQMKLIHQYFFFEDQ
jgi:hypothetical protein